MGLGAAPRPYEFAFDQPPGACAYVTLSLIGVPGTFPQPARIEIERVGLIVVGREAAP